MRKYKNLLFVIIFFSLEMYVLSNSNDVIKSFSNSLSVCLYTLMPTMFCSILFSQILIELEFERYIPKFVVNFFSWLFKITKKEVIIFFLSIISGYPNNAKMLQNNKDLDKLINYTNFVNPIFFIGTVGNLYLKNVSYALLILITHYLSNIILALILRNEKIKEKDSCIKENTKTIFDIYFISLKNTVVALCNIFSNILFFSVLLSLLNNILPFSHLINNLIIGLFEFSNGIYLISFENISLFLKGLLILIIITFGSFSIHMQMISVNGKIKYIKYFLYRIFNVFISITIYLIFTLIFLK